MYASLSEFQDTSLLHIPQNTLTEKSSIIVWSWILIAYLKELKTGEYYYSIIVWFQRFLWALSTAGIKKNVCKYMKNIFMVGWVSSQAHAQTVGCSAAVLPPPNQN